jgi:hypothetical protein
MKEFMGYKFPFIAINKLRFLLINMDENQNCTTLKQNFNKICEMVYGIIEKTICGLCKLWINIPENPNRHTTFWWKSLIIHFNKFLEQFMGSDTWRRPFLQPYVNLALLWINRAENWNCQTTFVKVSPIEFQQHLFSSI